MPARRLSTHQTHLLLGFPCAEEVAKLVIPERNEFDCGA